MVNDLTEAQRDELHRRLEEERARIVRVLATAPPGGPRRDQETEFEEAAQREAERAQDLAIRDRERALLAEVDRALAKFDGGRYGLSEKTGDPIPYERLAAVPWARDAVGE